MDTRSSATMTDARHRRRDRDELWTAFQAAVGRLRQRLQGNGASDRVLTDLFEDDLRQARLALRGVQDYLEDVMAAIGEPRLAPADLVAAADASQALAQLDQLAELIPSIRRRLGQAARALAAPR